jgi:hypothetical protein
MVDTGHGVLDTLIALAGVNKQTRNDTNQQDGRNEYETDGLCMAGIRGHHFGSLSNTLFFILFFIRVVVHIPWRGLGHG